MKKSFFISLFIHLFLFSALVSIQKLSFKEEVRPIKISFVKIEEKKTVKKKIKKEKVIKKREIKKEVKKRVVKKIKPKKKKIVKKKVVKKIKPVKKVVKKVVKKHVKKIEPVKKAEPKKEIKKETVKEPLEEKIVKKDINETEPTVKEIVKVTPKKEKFDEKSYIDEIISKIKIEIEKNKSYPKLAKRLKKEGIVEVEFILKENGEVKDIKIKKKAHKLLNRAAIKTVKKASSHFPKPKKDLRIVVPIEYKLTQI